MTIEIARHLRIVKADLDDDYVKKRQKAVTAVAKSFRKRTDADDLLALAEAMVRILHSSTLAAAEEITKEVADAISAESPSFVAEDATLEIGVCALLAAAVAIDGEKPAKGDAFNVTWFARAITLGIEALPARSEARIEALRMDLVRLGVAVNERDVEHSRKRDEASADLPAIKEAEAPDAYAKRLFEAMRTLCSSLARNADLDREELEALWWAFAGRSELLGCALASGEPRAAALASGVELGCLLEGPVAEAHRDLATRALPQGTGPLALKDFHSLEQSAARKIAAKLSRPAVVNYPAVFPLLSMMNAAAEGKPEPAVVDNERRPLEFWARRALDETWLALSTLEE